MQQTERERDQGLQPHIDTEVTHSHSTAFTWVALPKVFITSYQHCHRIVNPSMGESIAEVRALMIQSPSKSAAEHAGTEDQPPTSEPWGHISYKPCQLISWKLLWKPDWSLGDTSKSLTGYSLHLHPGEGVGTQAENSRGISCWVRAAGNAVVVNRPSAAWTEGWGSAARWTKVVLKGISVAFKVLKA